MSPFQVGEGLERALTWLSGHRVAACLSPAWRIPGGEPCIFNAALRFFLPSSAAFYAGEGPVPSPTPRSSRHHWVPLPSSACCTHLGACCLDGPCHCGAGGSCRTAPGPGEARWLPESERPKGSTTSLVLLQRSRCWARRALAPRPPGPWQLFSVCSWETGQGGQAS